jgi:hypothetical protein
VLREFLMKTALATRLWCTTDDETLRRSRRYTEEVVVESLAAPAWHRLSNRLLAVGQDAPGSAVLTPALATRLFAGFGGAAGAKGAEN